VLGWLDAVPDTIVRTDSRLAGCKAASLFMTGQPEAGESYLQSAEQNLPIDAPAAHRGTLLGLRCYSGEVIEALRLSQEALDQIGTSDPLSRSNILFMLGDAQDAVGDVAGAIQSFEEAVQLGQQSNNQMVITIAQGHLAISLNEQGKRSEAMALCRRGIERCVDTIGRPLPIACMFYVTLGTLKREANNLAQARQHIEQGLKLAQQSAMTRFLMYALEELAQVEYALGKKDVAIKMIQEAQQIAIQGGERTSWVNTIAAVEADFDLQAGKISTMTRWAETAEFATNPDPARKRQYSLYIRLLLAQKNLEEACALLTQLEHSAREDQRYRQLITFYIQHALAEHLLGHGVKAVSYLEQALRLAAPEGYSRAFIDEGRLVADLLPKARSIAPAFVDSLLETFASETEMVVSPLDKPLSEREIEVLRLMAKGLSSSQIAEKLIVAVSTVRSHRKHIYRKLDAHSRYEAIERAKTLGLL
jgi:LuxR family transcriptional regulator, maltose regulon positive regulatory protein